MGSKGALSVGRSDTAEESYIVTPRTVGDIPGTTRRDSLWSRERRVSCSAIAEHGITKGRQRYTDCYAAIPIAGTAMQQCDGRAKYVETWRLADVLLVDEGRRHLHLGGAREDR